MENCIKFKNTHTITSHRATYQWNVHLEYIPNTYLNKTHQKTAHFRRMQRFFFSSYWRVFCLPFFLFMNMVLLLLLQRWQRLLLLLPFIQFYCNLFYGHFIVFICYRVAFYRNRRLIYFNALRTFNCTLSRNNILVTAASNRYNHHRWWWWDVSCVFRIWSIVNFFSSSNFW